MKPAKLKSLFNTPLAVFTCVFAETFSTRFAHRVWISGAGVGTGSAAGAVCICDFACRVVLMSSCCLSFVCTADVVRDSDLTSAVVCVLTNPFNCRRLFYKTAVVEKGCTYFAGNPGNVLTAK